MHSTAAEIADPPVRPAPLAAAPDAGASEPSDALVCASQPSDALVCASEPSDALVCDAAAARIARPKRAPADSFVLHAPLELLARMALLPLVAPCARPEARARIAALGESYAAAGAEIEEPASRPYDDPERAAADLLHAVAAGELADADAAAAWLAAALAPEALVRALGDDVIPRLAAAAHGSIFLWNLPRIAPRSAAVARTLRGLVRELALERTWRLGWYRERRSGVHGTGDLVERLLAPPSPGDPRSSFIYPIMHLVEQSGLTADLLDAPTRDLDPAAASRALARVAAWSMLQDAPEHAPYGWSHCLSMPQAVLGIAHACTDPAAAVAVAATHVLGFRATLGRVRLDPAWTPEQPVCADPRESLDASPGEAAAGVWHAPEPALPALVTQLATRAALHHDAHLVKYTLACLDAGRADPASSRLFLAAAAYLSAWWREADGASGAA